MRLKISGYSLNANVLAKGIGIDYDAKDGYYYFSYWSMGLSNRRLSWKERLRYCWGVLYKGKAFHDEVMLNQADADKLVDFILGNKSLPEEKMQELLEMVKANLAGADDE